MPLKPPDFLCGAADISVKRQSNVQMCRKLRGVVVKISKVTLYSKLATCPSSEILLLLNRDSLPDSAEASVRDHLRSCDFCSAEFQLLALHATDLEIENAVAEMPNNLRLLAESILNGPSPSSATFFGKHLDNLPVSITEQ